VLACPRARLPPLALLAVGVAADGITGVAVTLPRPPALPVTEREPGDVDLRERNRDDVLALPADELALRDVFAQVLADLATDDGAEARMVLVDLQRHGLATTV
jgi:hypothetical protein